MIRLGARCIFRPSVQHSAGPTPANSTQALAPRATGLNVLPRNPSKGRTFARASGSVSVQVRAGDYFDGTKWVPQPLPSGTRPRLVLIHACSEDVRTKSPSIEIGESFSDFLRQLRIETDGRTMRYVRREMLALAACEMTFAWRSGTEVVQTKAPPIRKFSAWLVDDGQQRCMWPGQMKLDAEFSKHCLPMPRPSIRERSPRSNSLRSPSMSMPGWPIGSAA